MSYDDARAELGRRPVHIVEIDLDYCELTYNTAPCTADIGTTGSVKCYNTRKTCQDPDNYDRGTKTYRFSSQVLPASSDLDFVAIPCVVDVAHLPSRIEPGKGIGKRAVMTIRLRDFQMSDVGIDKYRSERTYDDRTTGTYFTKLMARNPYYQGRALRVRTGYLYDQQSPDDANFQTRLYRIERIDGPDKSGMVTITAKDPLKALDDKRAQAPRPSTGNLLAALNDSDGTFFVEPAGIGDAEYPTSGHIRIDDEMMSFFRSGDEFTVIRGTNFTTAEAHDEDAPVQLCLSYDGENIVDILEELLTTYAGVDSGDIDLTGWADERDTWLPEYDITAIVAEPMGVAKLVAEICEQCQLFIWWDERAQKIKLRAVRPWAFDQVTEVNDTANVLARSQSVKDRPEDRITQVQVYHGQKNPTEDLEKPWNFQRLRVNVDGDAEGEDEYGDARISTIYSRWLSASQPALAAKLAGRQLRRYRNTPRTITFRLDAKDSEAWTGDTILATIRTITDFSGAPAPTYLQVLEAREVVTGTEYEYVLEDTQFTGRYCLWGPDDLPDFTDATDQQRTTYGWYADDEGRMSTNADGYLYA